MTSAQEVQSAMSDLEAELPPLTGDRREWLQRMLLIRRFEEAGEEQSLRGKISAGIHPSIGQEGVAVGVMAATRQDDPFAGTHRSHHHAIARGSSPARLMAELFGRVTGQQRGRGGSMHIGDHDLANLGGNGIVGAGVGIAMGTALGIKLAGDDRVAVGFVGDGGANIGRLWEFVNMAAIWKLPLIIVLENNLYAVETPIDRMLGGGSITERAAAFGATAVQVDGQDADAVHDVVAEARARAVAGEGPTFVEALTYRYRGHGSGERASYRTPEEIEEWRSSRDPIDRLSAALIEAGELTLEERDQMDERARDLVGQAVAYANDAARPDPATLLDDVDGWAAESGARR